MSDAEVRSLEHRPVVEVLPQMSLRRVAETLAEESIGVAIVRAPHPPGPGTRAAGIVSERDVVNAIASGADVDRTRAEDVMTVGLASTKPGDSVESAAHTMLDNEVRHLPVMDDGAVVGMVSMRDALQALTG